MAALKIHGYNGYRVPKTGEVFTFCGRNSTRSTVTIDLQAITCKDCQKQVAKHLGKSNT